MARLARVVAPRVAHHVTQRGNRRLDTFLCDDDYRAYRALLAEFCAAAGVACWAYCLMPNHVHLILVPADEDGLRAALGEAHRRYTRRINLREGWRGHLWQERFHSFPMERAWLLDAARHVELNPLRAGLVKRARQWRGAERVWVKPRCRSLLARRIRSPHGARRDAGCGQGQISSVHHRPRMRNRCAK